MARKHGMSPPTRYRRARQNLSNLEALFAKLERSRPRTPGKKGAKTKALNALARKIPAAKGWLTRTRNAIARAAATRTQGKRSSRARQSEAARKGWATRRVRTPSAAPQAPPAARAPGKAMPFLTQAGVVWVWPPSKSDRSKVGSYWNAVDTFLDTGSTTALDRFAGDSIFDKISGRRLPFVTDPHGVIAYADEYHFTIAFYRDRREVSKFAA